MDSIKLNESITFQKVCHRKCSPIFFLKYGHPGYYSSSWLQNKRGWNKLWQMTWGEVRNMRAFSILEDHYLDWWCSLEDFNMRGSYLHQSQWLGHHYGRMFQWAAGVPATGGACYCVEKIRVLIGNSLTVQWLGLCVSTAWVWFSVGELITCMP